MKYSSTRTLKTIQKILDEDQFDDSSQNISAYGGVSGENILLDDFKRYSEMGDTLDVGCGSGDLFRKLPITHAIEPSIKRFEAIKKTKVHINQAFAECLPYTEDIFRNVICWGTVCFLRSPMEAFIEINRVMLMKGVFFFDMVIKSTMPIVQTVDRSSFCKHITLYGFEILKQEVFGEEHHKRLALVVRKIENFKPENFRMPQCCGLINNYLGARDWYLK